MLRHLSIKNVAVIECCEIDFDRGFQVLTGETGAGKSIIIDAINMLKGERASKELIRSGEEKARVDGIFEVSEETSEKIAEILGTDPECEIMISREMTSDGKNTIRVNGTAVTLGILKQVGELLVNIHGQHDNTSLLSAKTHIGFLDCYGGEKTKELKEKYKEVYENHRALKEELEKISTDEKENLIKRDMLIFQIEELEAASLTDGEEEEIKERKKVLDNFADISKNSSVAYEMLYGADSATCHDILWSAAKKIQSISDYSEELEKIYTALSDCAYIIDEQARNLRSFTDGVGFDEREAKKIDERLSLIYSLKRKYGQSIAEILEYLENAKKELESIDTSDERAKELENLIAKLEKERCSLASDLTDERKKNASVLSKMVKTHLTDLDMSKVDFDVRIDDKDFCADGKDDVEFLVRTNIGEEKRPLAKIASGGELSRIMLSIKNVLAEFEDSKTMIFDEIDTGVSGSAAEKIGEKLYGMSLSSQVICITHLPQISAFADAHYLIKKSVDSGRTQTKVELLSLESSVEEIARTLGGKTITDIAKENARQLKQSAEKTKNDIRKEN